jgi:hypothetical protein
VGDFDQLSSTGSESNNNLGWHWMLCSKSKFRFEQPHRLIKTQSTPFFTDAESNGQLQVDHRIWTYRNGLKLPQCTWTEVGRFLDFLFDNNHFHWSPIFALNLLHM